MANNINDWVDETISLSGELVLNIYGRKSEVRKVIGVLACFHDWYYISLDIDHNPKTYLAGDMVRLKDKLKKEDYEMIERSWPACLGSDFEEYIDWRKFLEVKYPHDLIILKGDSREVWMGKYEAMKEKWDKQEEEWLSQRDKKVTMGRGIPVTITESE